MCGYVGVCACVCVSGSVWLCGCIFMCVGVGAGVGEEDSPFLYHCFALTTTCFVDEANVRGVFIDITTPNCW